MSVSTTAPGAASGTPQEPFVSGGATAPAGEREELISQLDQAQEAFERRALSALAQPLASTSLTMQQFKVLTMITVDPGRATGQSLAGLLHVSLASMSGLVDRLVDHGMVTRTEDPHDRRVRRLSVTPAGSDVIRSLLSMAGTMPSAALRMMEIDDLRALVQGVRALDQACAQAGACAQTFG